MVTDERIETITFQGRDIQVRAPGFGLMEVLAKRVAVLERDTTPNEDKYRALGDLLARVGRRMIVNRADEDFLDDLLTEEQVTSAEILEVLITPFREERHAAPTTGPTVRRRRAK